MISTFEVIDCVRHLFQLCLFQWSVIGSFEEEIYNYYGLEPKIESRNSVAAIAVAETALAIAIAVTVAVTFYASYSHLILF